jgi:hypothetical protein
MSEPKLIPLGYNPNYTSAQTLTVDIVYSDGGRARCTCCMKLKKAAYMVYGRPASKPLDQDAFYCRDCAKKLGVGDYDPMKEKSGGK